MSAIYNKQIILSKFKTSGIHPDLVKNIITSHKECLLADKPAQPELISNPSINYSSAFNLDVIERFAKSSGVSKQKNQKINRHNPTTSISQNNPNPDAWRVPDDPAANDFFDDFKGKSDQTQVKQFINDKKHSNDLKVSNEVDVIINCIKKVATFNNLKSVLNKDEIFQNTKATPSKENTTTKNTANTTLNQKEKGDKVVGIPGAVHLFKGSEIYDKSTEEVKTLHTSKEVKETKQETPKKESKVEKPEPECDVDFSMLYLVNQKLNYPKEQPLWYIYHMVGKSSYGPLSSKVLEEMYRMQQLGKDTEIRLLDVFSFKNQKPFSFVKFIDIFEKGFLDKIVTSSLMCIVDTINNKKNEVVHKIEYKTKTPISQADSIYNVNPDVVKSTSTLNNTCTTVTQDETKSNKSGNSNNSGHNYHKANKQTYHNNANNYNKGGGNSNYYYNNNNYNNNAFDNEESYNDQYYNNSYNNNNNYNNGYNNNYNNNLNHNYNNNYYGNNNYNNNYNQNYNQNYNNHNHNNYNKNNYNNLNYNTQNQNQYKNQKFVDVDELFNPNSDYVESTISHSSHTSHLSKQNISNKSTSISSNNNNQVYESNEEVRQNQPTIPQEKTTKKAKAKPVDLNVKLGKIYALNYKIGFTNAEDEKTTYKVESRKKK